MQCDDNQPGPAGLSWSFNGYGRGSTNPGYGGNPPPFNGGGELPFGLGNCIRDGEIAGLTAGAKACQRVRNHSHFLPQKSRTNRNSAKVSLPPRPET